MSDREKGLYDKFTVTRTDGSSEEGGKHYNCRYFVLDLDHDPHAKAALLAYADSCEAEYSVLAVEIREALAKAVEEKLYHTIQVDREECWFECKVEHNVAEDGQAEGVHDVSFVVVQV